MPGLGLRVENGEVLGLEPELLAAVPLNVGFMVEPDDLPQSSAKHKVLRGYSRTL